MGRPPTRSKVNQSDSRIEIGQIENLIFESKNSPSTSLKTKREKVHREIAIRENSL